MNAYRIHITPRVAIVATPSEVARALAARGMPVAPGELDNVEAVPSMLAELRDLGHIFASERCRVEDA